MSSPAAVSEPADVLVFDVTGMDCGDCARSVERIVGQMPGIRNASVSFAAGTLTVDAEAAESPDMVRSIGGAVERAGYSAILRVAGSARSMDPTPWWRNRKLAYAAPAMIAWLVAFALLHFLDQEAVAIGLFAVTIVVGGYPVARAALASLRARRIDMNVLMTISVIGAVALGEWSEGALVVVLFTLGTTLQSIAFDHTRRAIRSLLDLSPDEAVVVRDGVELTVATSSLAVGDVVRVRPGDRVAADGVVISGSTAINQAAITGESVPVTKSLDDDVFGGTVNGAGAIDVRVSRPADQSTIANIVRMVEDAQSKRAPSQLTVDRFASFYTPAVVVVAALIAVTGGFILGDPDTWIYRALVLLVVACPCALVISTPVSIVSAIGAATRSGVLVKGGAALETFGKAQVIAFDKTGTLTFGRPAVVDIVPLAGQPAPEVLRLAASAELDSEHPLGRAIVARALHDEVVTARPASFAALTGRGIQARVDGRDVVVGSSRLLADLGATVAQLAAVDAASASHEHAGRSVVAVAERLDSGVALIGVIAVADRIRPDAASALTLLRESGVKHLVMLTGDRAPVAKAIAQSAGVDVVRAELMPDEKLEAIDDLRQRYGTVAMVGDGINDAPALAAADIGVAMGMAGSDVALESADLALMQDDLGALERLHRLSQRTISIIRQNVVLSLVTKVLALGLGALGFVSLWIAVLVDVGTSLIVTFNGFRLSREVEQRVLSSAPVADCGCGEDHDHGHDHAHSHA